MQRFTMVSAVLFMTAVPALANMLEVSLQQRVDEAAIIVEARVVGSTAFTNADGTRIFTAHRLDVYKVFKAAGPVPGEIEVVTLGGRLGDQWHTVVPALELHPGQAGIFFLESREGYAGRSMAHISTAGPQGFVRYDEPAGKAFDPFNEYDDITKDLHGPIQRRTRQPYQIVNPFGAIESKRLPLVASHSISGFSPTTVDAGVQELLTISGSGFGTLTGSATVLFDDTDDGPGGLTFAADPEHIVSWTDSQIEVYVPARLGSGAAGTGKITVRDSAGVDAVSASDLTVRYALKEVLSSSTLYRTSLLNQNVRGGYTVQYSTNTANSGVDFTGVSGATDRFVNALREWNCETGWNVDVDGTTTVNTTGNDGVNMIAFENDSEPLGSVLGRASLFFQNCGGDSWHLEGFDIRFKRPGTGVNWYFGSSPAGIGGTEQDFQSTALHELGHSVTHGHINDNTDPMYFTPTAGLTMRTLTSADIQGGLDQVSHSSGFALCGGTAMASFDCSAAPTANFTADAVGTCGNSLTVNFSDLSTNGPTSWSWSFGDTATSTARNPSHTYNGTGTHAVSLTAMNGNGSDVLARDDYIILTSAPVAASCAPTFVGHNDCCSIGIVNLTLNTIDNTTATPTQGDPLYEDFTCSQFTVLTAGSSYPIAITNGSNNNENVSVYIDWNNDGTLGGGELAFSSTSATFHSGTVSVPTNAILDTALRMRVLSDFSSVTSPCESIAFGQVEDYSVIVTAAGVPGAVPETSLLLSKNGAQPTHVDFNWGASCGSAATDYTIHEGEIGMWYSHDSAVCSIGRTSYSDLTPSYPAAYYLVVPISAIEEGSYGLRTGPAERPQSGMFCLATQNTTTCP